MPKAISSISPINSLHAFVIDWKKIRLSPNRPITEKLRWSAIRVKILLSRWWRIFCPPDSAEASVYLHIRTTKPCRFQNFNLSSDERIRQLYVAMTRARRELTIHLNSDFLDSLSSEDVEHIEDKIAYLPPEEVVFSKFANSENFPTGQDSLYQCQVPEWFAPGPDKEFAFSDQSSDRFSAIQICRWARSSNDTLPGLIHFVDLYMRKHTKISFEIM